jgi:hypothetical protein
MLYLIPMNKLSPAKRTQIVAALVEGNSIRATCRMTDTAKGTAARARAPGGGVPGDPPLRGRPRGPARGG